MDGAEWPSWQLVSPGHPQCTRCCVCALSVTSSQSERRANGRSASRMRKPSGRQRVPGLSYRPRSVSSTGQCWLSFSRCHQHASSRAWPVTTQWVLPRGHVPHLGSTLTSPGADMKATLEGLRCVLMISSKCGSYKRILTLTYAIHLPAPKDTHKTQNFRRTYRMPAVEEPEVKWWLDAFNQHLRSNPFVPRRHTG